MVRLWRKFKRWAFWETESQGATLAWSPVGTTNRVGNSDVLFEHDLNAAFDKIVEALEAEPDWLVVFKSKTAYMQFHLDEANRQKAWERKYENLNASTAYTLEHAKRLNSVLA